MIDSRLQSLQEWLKNNIATHFDIIPIIGDASFRRYFRVFCDEKTFIAVDAPPQQENSYPFVAIASAFNEIGIRVPDVFFSDLDNGFLLLSDFGDQLYYQILRPENADALYGNALEELLKIQSCKKIPQWPLPEFDRSFIAPELLNFRTWFLEAHLKMQLSHQEDRLLITTFETLIQSAITQPQCCIHRDYHSKNLMVVQDQIGVLDFQDAAWGPITYDAVSLLRDCYIVWPQKKVEQWILNFYDSIKETHGLTINKTDFLRWFDWMGIQRHLKAIFIFARKYHRDHVDNYLQYIPNGLKYIVEISENYPELKAFHLWIKTVILPRYENTHGYVRI